MEVLAMASTALKEQAIELLDVLPDDRVEIIIKVMQGFITPIGNSDCKRIGVAKGKFIVPDDIDECNGEIAEMFGVNR
jgi:hypothetical protein